MLGGRNAATAVESNQKNVVALNMHAHERCVVLCVVLVGLL